MGARLEKSVVVMAALPPGEAGQWAQANISKHLGLGSWSIMRPRFVEEYTESFIAANEKALDRWWRNQSSATGNATNKKIVEENRKRLLSTAQPEPVDAFNVKTHV